MTTSVQQLFVRSSNKEEVVTALREYVDVHANQFIQCSTVFLEGVQQVLAALVRKKREFHLCTVGDWTAIWEIVDRTEFADPSIAKFISERLQTESIWLKIDYDYNIWAFQVFESGVTVAEDFLPESYFKGDPESENRYDYGSCGERAEAFNATRSLPLFLETIPSIERKASISKNVTKLTCRIPAKT